MHCFYAALAALTLLTTTTLAHSNPKAKRHASIASAFSPRSRSKRQSFLSTTQPGNLAEGTATADEGCTLWIQPWDGASCLAIITYSPGLILQDFIELNPSVDTNCSNLQSNVNYCIDTDDDHELSTSTGRVNAVAKPSCGTKKMTATKTPSQTSSGTETTSNTPAPTSTSKQTAGKIIGGLTGLLEMYDPKCGASDPSRKTTDKSGPNGAVEWLNCGISTSNPTSGWTAPDVDIHQVIYQNISTDGVYAPCAPYLHLFEEAGAKYDIPPIFLASFAMQESTCNPNASGDEGAAFGLMQITSDKCGNAPNGNCNDPEYNVMTAAAYFDTVLRQQCNGNVLCAVGAYNGWPAGMSYDYATAQRNSCCVCQNNLDYLHQFFNAWIQNLNGLDFTPYDNLRPCETWWNGKK